MSWVLVYCLQVITWLVDMSILNYKIECNCMINHFSALVYPFICCMFCVCGFLFLRWSSIYWWEHMRELLVVNRERMIPLLSLSGIVSVSSSFYLGSWLMYHHVFKYLSFVLCFVLASWCALVSFEYFYIIIWSGVNTLNLRSLYYIVWCFHLIKFNY